MRSRVFLVLAALGAISAPVPAQEQAQGPNPVTSTSAGARAPHSPNLKPTLAISRARGAILIDGKLDDAGWAGAARALNFTEASPRDLARPSVETEAWITYDEDNLYVAFIARDDPATIRSSLTDRDRMFQDDYVGVLLDTYGDASWAYLLFANPKGIQGDSRMAEGRGEDDRMDIIFHSSGQITEEGYIVEMAIPFASLRFPPAVEQTWRATFWRNRPRGNREQMSWASLSRNDPCMLCQMGTLTGLEGIRPGGALEVLPTLVASQAGALATPRDASSGFRNASPTADMGVSARYSFANGLTAEATFNPDFSQVESDAGQVDVNSTFALFFPEQRTFFQEGSDLFSTRINAVYTRSINKPIAAGKLIGRMGRTTIAYLGARDDNSPLLLPFEERSVSGQAGKSVSNVLRFRQTFGRNSYLGALVTDRRMDGGGSGSLVGFDGKVGFGGVYSFDYQVLGSLTVEPDAPLLLPALGDATFAGGRYTARLDGERFSGLAQQYSFARNARGWDWDVTFRSVSPTFRADNGFETRNNLRRLTGFQSYSFYPNGRVVQRISPTVVAHRTWNFDGDIKGQAVEARLNANLVGQTFVQVTARTADERFRGADFRGLRSLNIHTESNFSGWMSLGGSIGVGDGVARNLATPAEGQMRDLSLWLRLRPTTWATVSPSINHSRMTGTAGQEIYDGYILRTRADLQFTRELFLRTVVQYNDFSRQLSIEPLLTYRVNPFTMVYLGSTRGYTDLDDDQRWTRTSTQYFTKVQYLLRK